MFINVCYTESPFILLSEEEHCVIGAIAKARDNVRKEDIDDSKYLLKRCKKEWDSQAINYAFQILSLVTLIPIRDGGLFTGPKNHP